ncbi:DHHC zinc finger domain-like protein [Leptomonas pyrrhocoris]|uniref:Palmitoyltransferase n=1 Tax=Leptomonas pyrrhocoris TaxID=157538 RepID=A0A0N0DY74_LEPPY|nr:DHHC zinc finger domain-like protein [Leptomonas pyrrhocoris]KPA83825.1 DHHC zinc finger domain-like protein [Leptomonas pyrrhocoris]|eukprot:XP_015662264.1 DHHC zinc finger domain-like protein [Leptomonas pyrrhocoris]
MTECRCLNKHSHPAATRGCAEGCMMCCGYTTPAVIGFLIAGLVVASDVYSIILIARNPHSAWCVIVCLIVFLFTTVIGVVVCWSYYAIIFTPPGFVPHETWQYPPAYGGPPLPQRDQGRGQARFPAGGGGGEGPGASQPPQPGGPAHTPPPQQQQQLAPSLSRRSPNHSGDRTDPSSYPTPPPGPPPQLPARAAPTTSANPLQDGEDAAPRKATSDAGGAAVVAAVLFNDSDDSGNGGPRERPRQNHDDATKLAEGAVVTGGAAVSPAGAQSGSHSPYSTPRLSLRLAPATAAAAPPSAPLLNPYTVHQVHPNGSLRYCYACHQFKPDDAHHCRMCERCVFNFDHHCPFVNNCVGRNNYKLFVVFLLYSGVGATLGGALMAVTLFAVDRDEMMSKIGWAAVPAVDVVLGLSLLLFYVQHRVLLCRGESTLDSIARGDDTFQGWRQAFTRPKRSAAEKEELKRQKAIRVERHYRALLGNESPWWRRYLPSPVRTDDRADDTVSGNV